MTEATPIIPEIVKSLQMLHAARPFELRLFHAKGNGKILSGIYQDVEKAAADAAQANGAGYLVYVTLNQLDQDVLKDTQLDVLRPASETTKEQDITHRRWLLIDVDAKRGDKDGCSTESEKAAGRSTAIAVRNHLHDHGWPDPILAVVGRTSVGRKGTGLDVAGNVFNLAVPNYGMLLHGGLSTGEGLIAKVADPVIRTDKEGGLVVVSDGVEDNRALFLEAELAAVLQRFRREGNILSQVLRDGWDDKILSISTKSNPMRSTGSHVCLIGHVTPLEIMTSLRPIDIAGGLANRFLWFHSIRHQRLPAAPSTPEAVLSPLVARLQAALNLPDGPQQIGLTAAAEAQWHYEYHRLADEAEAADEQHEGLLARAHAQVRRLAGIYAVADQTMLVDVPHLAAAVSVVDYSRTTLRYLFEKYMPTESTTVAANDPEAMAQRIWEGVQYGSMTRSQISDLFHRNRTADEVTAALELLVSRGQIVREPVEPGPGRPAERYRAGG
ncbi:MAG: DUF3987 domain-containing protein [Planctomycetota bacterium]